MDEKNVLVSLRINKTELQIVLAERRLIVRKDFWIVDRCIAIILRIRKGDAESKIVFYRIIDPPFQRIDLLFPIDGHDEKQIVIVFPVHDIVEGCKIPIIALKIVQVVNKDCHFVLFFLRQTERGQRSVAIFLRVRQRARLRRHIDRLGRLHHRGRLPFETFEE